MNGGEVAMYVLKAKKGPSAADLIPLELWYRPGDHYLVASAAGIADAKANGYVKQETLGFVWPPPGSVPGVAARYGLPSISKDDRACEHSTTHCMQNSQWSCSEHLSFVWFHALADEPCALAGAQQCRR